MSRLEGEIYLERVSRAKRERVMSFDEKQRERSREGEIFGVMRRRRDASRHTRSSVDMISRAPCARGAFHNARFVPKRAARTHKADESGGTSGRYARTCDNAARCIYRFSYRVGNFASRHDVTFPLARSSLVRVYNQFLHLSLLHV